MRRQKPLNKPLKVFKPSCLLISYTSFLPRSEINGRLLLLSIDRRPIRPPPFPDSPLPFSAQRSRQGGERQISRRKRPCRSNRRRLYLQHWIGNAGVFRGELWYVVIEREARRRVKGDYRFFVVVWGDQREIERVRGKEIERGFLFSTRSPGRCPQNSRRILGAPPPPCI